MKNIYELGMAEACAVYGGKDKDTAKLVAFIAECIGSIAKMIYMANKFRKMFSAPATL